MTRIYYESDFQCRVTLISADGTTLPPPVDHAWEIHFTDHVGNCYRCGFDGTNYEDCTVVDDVVECYIDNPGFYPGVLKVTFVEHIPDANFADGVDRQVSPAPRNILLWQGGSDGEAVAELSVLLPVITPRVVDAKVSDGDLLITFNN